MAENKQLGAGGISPPKTSQQTTPQTTSPESTRSPEEIERDIEAKRERHNHPNLKPHLEAEQAQTQANRESHHAPHASGTAQAAAAPSAAVHDAARRDAAHGKTPQAQNGEDVPERLENTRRHEGDDRNKTSAELEREVEYERQQLTRTLDQIRSRVSPGQIMDQAVQYARNAGGAEFGRNLGRSIRDNPLPVVLVGAGLGWLMMSSISGNSSHRHNEPRGQGPEVREQASKIGADISERVDHAADAASDLASSARDGLHRATDRASSAFQSASETGGAVIDRARDTIQQTGDSARNAMHHASEYAHDTRIGVQRSFMRLATEQPAALGAIGLALGAAIAAMLPPTRIENRIMGSASDTLKDQVKGSVKRQYEHAQEVVEETAKDISQDFEDRGISVQGVADAAVDATRKVGDSAKEVAKSAKSEIRQQTGKQGAGATKDSSVESAKSSSEREPGSNNAPGSLGETGRSTS